MPPAARVTDVTTHGTPLAPGPGSTNVLIGFMPAWRATTDQHACPAVSITGADGIGSVLMGSPTVFINYMMACRMGDIVVEKPGLALGPVNPIVMGCPTVMIGDAAAVTPGAVAVGAAMAAMSSVIGGEAGAAAGALAGASQSGAGTIDLGGRSALSGAAGGPGQSSSGNSGSGNQNSGGSGSNNQTKTWVEIELLDKQGQPVPNEPYRIELPDGTASEGSTDDRGRARVDGIDPGNCKISFPSLDQSSWRKR